MNKGSGSFRICITDGVKGTNKMSRMETYDGLIEIGEGDEGDGKFRMNVEDRTEWMIVMGELSGIVSAGQ